MQEESSGERSRSSASLFDEFVHRDSGLLLRIAWGLTGDRSNAEDLVQAALERVWTRWERIAKRDDPAGYARRVVVSLFLTSRRRRWWTERPSGELPEQVSVDIAETVAVRDAVSGALRRLPARQRAVVVLRYLDDRSEAQTAEVMGCSVGTVKSQAARALIALRNSSTLTELWPRSGGMQKEMTQ